MSGEGEGPEEFSKQMEQAAAKGAAITYGSPNQLLLDLNGTIAITRYLSMLSRVKSLFGATLIREYESKSGPGHFHVVLSLEKEHSAEARIAMQAALGSDPVRELLALARLAHGVKEPSALFRWPEGSTP